MKLLSLLKLAGFSAIALSFSASASHADWQYRVGIGAGAVPEFEGSEDYQPIPLVDLEARRDWFYVQTQGLGLKANLSPYKNFDLGPVVGYNGGRDDGVENTAVSKLDEVDASFETGLFASYSIPKIFSATDAINLGASFMADVSDGHDGVTGDLSIGYSLVSAKRKRLGLTLSTTYADDAYMESFFSVNAAGAARSGLAQYDASGGFKDVGLTFTGVFPITRKWSVTGIASYKVLISDAADSPIVDKEGTPHQFFGGLVLSYSF